MPTFHTTSVLCPSCGQSFPVVQHTILNPNTDPTVRERVISGALFQNTCPHCGKQQIVGYPCVYLDTKKQFAVYLKPDPAKRNNATLLPSCRMRVEYTLKDFVERVRILDAGFNDLAFELFRTVLQAQVKREFPQKSGLPLRFDSKENKELYFQIGANDMFKVPYVSYERIADKASKFRVDQSTYLHIDSAWVQKSGILRVLG